MDHFRFKLGEYIKFITFSPKRFLSLALTVFLFVTLPMAVILVQKSQEMRSKAAPATNITFNPIITSAKIGDTFTLNGTFNAGTNLVTGAEIHLTFDKTLLEAVSIESNTTLFPNVFSPGPIIDNVNGTASIIAGCAVTNPVSGNGNLFSVTFKALAAGNSQVSFASTSLITAIGESTNVLVSSIPAAITITSGTTPGISPTPTPTPIPTFITPMPTPTPTPKPTIIPTPTPKPTILPTPTPTTIIPTPTIQPTPTSIPTPPPSQFGVLSGIVTSQSTGQPISGVQIKASYTGIKGLKGVVGSTTTNTNGTYSLQLNPAKYAVQAQTSGYTTQKTTTTIVTNQTTYLNFIMTQTSKGGKKTLTQSVLEFISPVTNFVGNLF